MVQHVSHFSVTDFRVFVSEGSYELSIFDSEHDIGRSYEHSQGDVQKYTPFRHGGLMHNGMSPGSSSRLLKYSMVTE
jgi:hypothetical protein